MPPFFFSISAMSRAPCGFAIVARHGLLPRFTQQLFQPQTFEPQLDFERHGRIDRKLALEGSAENEQKLAQ